MTPQKFEANGVPTDLCIYNIDGSNYFKLRELCRALDIGVIWNAATNTMGIDTSTGYTE